MNYQHFFKLVYGLFIFNFVIFISCSDNEIDDLKSRVTVVEGMIRDLKADLENATSSGATITSAQKNEKGEWVLVLSDGKTIEISPNQGGGDGSAINVTISDDNAVITVDGVDYVIPFMAPNFNIVYSPETLDGVIDIGLDGEATANFLVRPEVNDDILKDATFEIAEAHELKIRSNGTMFKINGEVSRDGSFIQVPIKALNVEGGKHYAVALQMTVKESVYISNYFNISIADGFSFIGEEIIVPQLITDITDFTELENGFSTATLPDDVVDFLGTFDFKDLFVDLPEGIIEFELGYIGDQNKNVQGRYDFFKSCLNPDGTWTMVGRPGTNGSASENESNPDGLLINLKADDVVKAKIYWKVDDPIADLNFEGAIGGSPHLEYGEIFEKGANIFDIQRAFGDGEFSIQHDDGRFTEAWSDYEVSYSDAGDVIYVDGSNLDLGEIGKKYARFSKGIYWKNIQTSIAASQGSGGNGEIIKGWDGLSAQDMVDLGIVISEDGELITTNSYGGYALRAGPGVRFEYAYGEKSIGSDVIAFIWFNRRVSPEGVVNLEER